MLEHDFGKPDGIRIADLPRQIVAAVLPLPSNQAFGKSGGVGHKESFMKGCLGEGLAVNSGMDGKFRSFIARAIF